MRFLLLLIGVALFIGSLTLGWTFGASNEALVDLDLIWLKVPSIELWKVLLAAALLGGGLASFFLTFAWMRSAMVGRRFKKMVKKLEKEVHELRSLPLVGSGPDGLLLDQKNAEAASNASGASPENGPGASTETSRGGGERTKAAKPKRGLISALRPGASAKKKV